MVAWISLWTGTIARNPTRAILTAVGVLVAWCAGPPLVIFLIHVTFFGSVWVDQTWYLMLLSPATIVPVAEFRQWSYSPGPAWLVLGVNFALYGDCWGCSAGCAWPRRTASWAMPLKRAQGDWFSKGAGKPARWP